MSLLNNSPRTSKWVASTEQPLTTNSCMSGAVWSSRETYTSANSSTTSHTTLSDISGLTKATSRCGVHTTGQTCTGTSRTHTSHHAPNVSRTKVAHPNPLALCIHCQSLTTASTQWPSTSSGLCQKIMGRTPS